MSNNDHIFSLGEDNRPELSQELLQAYLEGRLSHEEQHRVEEWLAEEGMESDALEGLKEMDAGEVKQSASRLKQQLLREVSRRKTTRQSDVMANRWALAAIFLILLLCVIGYVAIKLVIKN